MYYVLNIVVSPYLYIKVRAVFFSNNIVKIFIQKVCIANDERLFNVLIFFYVERVVTECHNMKHLCGHIHDDKYDCVYN